MCDLPLIREIFNNSYSPLRKWSEQKTSKLILF